MQFVYIFLAGLAPTLGFYLCYWRPHLKRAKARSYAAGRGDGWRDGYDTGRIWGRLEVATEAYAHHVAQHRKQHPGQPTPPPPRYGTPEFYPWLSQHLN